MYSRKPSPFRLYLVSSCSYCERVVIAACKKGIEIEVANAATIRDPPPWFYSNNPEGIVPVLRHKGKVCDAIREISFKNRLTGNVTLLALELTKAEKMLKSPFYSGKELGLPDIVLYPFIQRLYMIRKIIHDDFLAKVFAGYYPKLLDWFNRMRTLPEVVIN
ncbi:unnamed protein product [Onchocerca flexuosa]|uniref:GST C-terminal domain-containing protein n=1 Tax=Onchocerca flexuosa TaxID=387005 RepID=A0A183HE11_9BILA|nr:unnamed protein product [Onchocerca flexuosa]